MILNQKIIDADRALTLAEQASKRSSDTISDAALIHRLADSARAIFAVKSSELSEEALADALSIVDAAVRRRMGIWRAILEEVQELSGPIRQIRLLADDLLDPTNPDAPIHSISRYKSLRDWATVTSENKSRDPDIQAALRWLLIARFRMRAEHPPHIHFPPNFYQSLRGLDKDDCLLYEPTRQQLAASALLLRGAIVEMDAGEGKTLASAIAALVFAASGRRVHILTANDYLAARDCDDLTYTMESLGVAPGLVTASMDSEERGFQYPRPIVFATAREVGFDYLRDNIARRHERRVSPIFDVAVVDEADHLLIDQARTPLIISGEPIAKYEEDEDPENLAIRMIEEQAAHVDSLYSELDESIHANESTDRILATILLAEGLGPRLVSVLEQYGRTSRQLRESLLILNDDDDDNPLEGELLFTIDAANRALRITARGWDFITDRLDNPTAAFEVAQILRARVVHGLDEDYVIDPDGITLVDRLDGRPMHSHRYVNGLHEAIEAKEGIEDGVHANPVARATIHALMSNYATIAGLTGTATDAADIFAVDYGASAVRVPPTFTPRRIDLASRIYFDKSEHTRALSDEIARCLRIGRPVLVAFGSVRESGDFSGELERQGIAHRLLNASNPAQESGIVARAGEFGAVTVSTGMAGRGTDIIVADDVNSSTAESLGHTTCHSEESRGLLVIIASLPSSRRVERQLRGRAARQGSPGASVMTLYINDPVLAFTRQQTALFQMRNPGDIYVQGPRVQELLRLVQSEAESQNRAIVEATADFAAIIESESRAYYAHRGSMMDSQACRQLLDNDVSSWVERKTKPLRDIRSNYYMTFDSVAESLWNEYRIDIGSADHTSPAEAADILTHEVENRLFRHRTRLGDRRFIFAASDMYLDALDALWPDHLAALQDIALSLAMTAQSHAAALIQFGEQALVARSELRNATASAVIDSLLNSDYIESPTDLDDDQTEQLPSQLSDLIT